MDLGLQGKVALVTGGAGELGERLRFGWRPKGVLSASADAPRRRWTACWGSCAGMGGRPML